MAIARGRGLAFRSYSLFVSRWNGGVGTLSSFHSASILNASQPVFKAGKSSVPLERARSFHVNSNPRPSRHFRVAWPQHGDSLSFDAVFLRDCCSCERCVDRSTTQKTFESVDIPPTIRPSSLTCQDDGTVRITWTPELPGFEDHVSLYDSSFIQGNVDLQSRLIATPNLPEQPRPWDRNVMAQNQLNLDFTSYMNSSSSLFSGLYHLNLYGLLFVHSVPSTADAVKCIAERIGPIKETLYGSTWDVRSVPSAKNVAYTSSHLGFHMVRRHRCFLDTLTIDTSM